MARAAKQRSSKSRGEGADKNGPDVVALLKQDHADVKKLFKQFEKADDEGEKEQLARQICQMLTIHATCEEELVYPAAREVLDDEDLIPEAEIEHETAKSLIAQIEQGSPGDERFDALVTVLGEYIDHHVTEEEGEILPKLKSNGLDVRALGGAVEARKAELMTELGMDLPDDAEDEEDEESEERDEADEDGRHQGSRGGSQSRRDEREPRRQARRR